MKIILSLTVQFLLLTISWFLVIYFFDIDFYLSKNDISYNLKLILFVSWGLTTWLTQKYKPKYYQRKISYVMAPFLKSGVIMIVLCWIFLQFFIDNNLDKIITYKTIILYFFLEFILYTLSVVINNRKNYNTQIQNNVNLYKQHDLSYDDYKKQKIEIGSAVTNLKYFDGKIINKLADSLIYYKNSQPSIRVSKDEKDHLTPDTFISVLDFKINDLKNIDRYIRDLYAHTINGGYVSFVYKELGLFEKELIKGESKIGRFTALLNYYIFKRAIPKIPYLNQISFFLTKGKNKVLSKAEVWGRLSFAGFEVENEIIASGLSYVLVRKVKTPSENPSPSYYPIITLNRVSLYGKIIKIHKLRSMYPYSEFLQKKVFEMNSLSGIGKINDDFRITTFGKFYRKYWIDELPQLIDWLRGEIKLVGIRAMSQHYFSLYTKEYQELFFKVKPGIISPIFDEEKDSFETIQKIEQEYLEKYLKHPLRTDIEYFFKTFSQIIKGVRSK